MTKPSFKWAVRVCPLLIVLSVSSRSNAGQTIIPIATSHALGGLGMTIPSINDHGLVAFIDTTPGTNGVYVGSGGALTTIATSSTLFNQYGAGGGTPYSFDAGPIINNSGAVAFWANTGIPTAPGILVGTIGNLQTVVSGPAPVGTTGSTFYTGAPQISDLGDIAFATRRLGGFTGAGVFATAGDSLTPLVATDTELRTVVDPAISPNGTIAYGWQTLNQFGGPTADNLYTVHNGVTTPVVSFPFDFMSYIAVNDHGTVAVTLAHSIQMGSSGPLTTIADTSGPFGSFGAVSINNWDRVAFYGSLAFSGIKGIFTGPDPLHDKVIATGDSLLGATVTELAFGRRGLNDQGQIAFWARLDNGEQGIFVATPVPEPATGTLLALGLGLSCFAITRRSRRRRPHAKANCDREAAL